MSPQAAVASVTAVHRPGVLAARRPSRSAAHHACCRLRSLDVLRHCLQSLAIWQASRHDCRRSARTPLPVAQARRKKEESQVEELAADWKDLEVSPALAAQTDDLVQMLPDPANPPESLLDENFDSCEAAALAAASPGIMRTAARRLSTRVAEPRVRCAGRARAPSSGAAQGPVRSFGRFPHGRPHAARTVTSLTQPRPAAAGTASRYGSPPAAAAPVARPSHSCRPAGPFLPGKAAGRRSNTPDPHACHELPSLTQPRPLGCCLCRPAHPHLPSVSLPCLAVAQPTSLEPTPLVPSSTGSRPATPTGLCQTCLTAAAACRLEAAARQAAPRPAATFSSCGRPTGQTPLPARWVLAVAGRLACWRAADAETGTGQCLPWLASLAGLHAPTPPHPTPPRASAHACPCRAALFARCAAQVGEGSSFRRDQRERYVPPLGGANLAHVAEEELLTPEQLVRLSCWECMETRRLRRAAWPGEQERHQAGLLHPAAPGSPALMLKLCPRCRCAAADAAHGAH